MARDRPNPWHILTGEYPPAPGGIADYSALVASSLASTGLEVHVWTSSNVDCPPAPGVTIHRSTGWSRADLARLGEALDRTGPGRRLFVQYAPNLYGRKGMNLGFCRWLVGRKDRGDRIATMFHEVHYLPGPGDTRLIRRILPAIQRPMARRLMTASERIYVSTRRWAQLLSEVDPKSGHAATWLPVPSTIPMVDDPAGVAAIRHGLGKGRTIVGSFGTFSNAAGTLLAEVFPGILEDDPGRIALLIGRKGDEFATKLVADRPALEGRILATGGLDPVGVSLHLQACDLLAQPYPDGVCGRRTTAMAGLSHGVAIVSNRGSFTEPEWAEGVALAGDWGEFRRSASELLADPSARARLASSGRAVYDRRFSIGRTVAALLDPPDARD